MMNNKIVDDLFFKFFCEKNSDGTKNLRLHGRELYQRFGRRLNKDDMLKLARFMRKRLEITSLNLAYNDIGDEGMKAFAKKYFSKDNNLSELNLLHCDIKAEGMKYLSNGKFLKLRSLRLLGNKLGMQGARFIGILIDNCSTLEDLDIGETDQTLESIESLLIVIEKSSLKSVNISRIIPSSFYSSYNKSALADDLGILLKTNDSLEVLTVQKCGFDGKTLKVIGESPDEIIMRVQSERDLKKIKGHDVELLLGGLRIHKNLQMLDLASNNIGDHGMEFLANWLKTRPNLIGLRVPANDISNTGAQALGLMLPFSRIRLLDIQNNNIGENGLSDLFISIKKSTQLRMLYIWGNKLSHDLLEMLQQMIEAGVIYQEYIDVKIYVVDGIKHGAYYPTNRRTQKIYSILDYGYPPDLKIVKNKIPEKCSKPRTLVNFTFVERFPILQSSETKENKAEPELDELLDCYSVDTFCCFTKRSLKTH